MIPNDQTGLVVDSKVGDLIVRLWLFHYSISLPLLIIGRQVSGIGLLSEMPKVVAGTTFFATLFALYRRRNVKLPAYFVALVFACIYGLSISFIPRVYPPNLRAFIPQLFIPVYGAISILLFSNLEIRYNNLLNLLRRTANRVLVSYSALILFYLIFYFGRIYPGIASMPLLVPLCVGILDRSRIKTILALLLIILSAKRGTYIAVPVVIGVLAWLAGHRLRLVNQTVAWIAGIISGGLVARLLVPGLFRSLTAVLSARTSTIFRAFQSEGQGVTTGGRSNELEGALKLLSDEGAIGSGLGFGYEFVAAHPLLPIEITIRGTHITPMNYVLKYGLPVAVALYAVLFLTLLRVCRSLRRMPRNSGERIVGAYSVAVVCGLIVVGLTTHVEAQDGIYWILLGVMWSAAFRSSGGISSSRTSMSEQRPVRSEGIA